MKHQSGFTVAELAVSLAILGIMAALTTPNYLAEMQQRRAEVTVADTQAIVDAARSYRVSNGAWPGDATCSNALSVLQGASPAYLRGSYTTNKYDSPLTTSCTTKTFSVDQNVIADWDGYIINSLSSTQIADAGTHLIRTTIGLPGTESALDSKLSRIATGNAELNRMRTTLLMGGNDISEINNLSAAGGSFTGNVSAGSVSATTVTGSNVSAGNLSASSGAVAGALSAGAITAQQAMQIYGVLYSRGTSQFTGKSYFEDELVLNKVVTDGAVGCTAGAIARDSTGRTMSCQGGAWKANSAQLSCFEVQSYVSLECPSGYAMTSRNESFGLATCCKV
ncbi:prepilin-type N-terminal cleavage/methylation domain-containing protein [Pseudomonas putida]|uniref:prepilin-type N-terminal cleavage/methylation domain-containing protein n=1 Tax=Pseudomonas putida TaxID=303 RepID=UPI0023631C0F|nr:prepilin-type N-terminal cleavage/methylation domain-containing protein [Pseudomonas putida]MDD2139495.1 prepilin-type N-terminal cleavage/methylation domain-containing protein [Pseudomonas putida]HDS1721824.1 prepilin-type N-terminal cleavage/methylation domain-containing protein [Pseudomonas putida]